MNANLLNDVNVLLNRALKGWEVSIFGEDGNGRYARFSFPICAAIVHLDVLKTRSTDDTIFIGLQIHAGTRYMVKDESVRVTHGRPDGDQNLRLGLNQLFKNYGISRSCWKFTYLDVPEYDVVLEIDLDVLLT